MGKVRLQVNSYFTKVEKEDGQAIEVIYNPPLLAECGNIRVELRKEATHTRPHVHILKKGRTSGYELSLALDSGEYLAGSEKNTKYFDQKELDEVLVFIGEHLDDLQELYRRLRGEV